MLKARRKKNATVQWFDPGRRLHWSKSDGQTTRRDAALKSRRGNFLKAARALMALANVTRDTETARKARSDSLYFYRQFHKKQVAVE
jgi:hypothetical protein